MANFEQFKYGQWYMCLDSKLSNGLIQLGHSVYNFSHRDIARAENPFKSKYMGAKIMNKRLLESCENYQPDFILLGHSELVTLATIKNIRKILPHCKIAMWYCDPLFQEHGLNLLNSRTEILDALFTTTGGQALAQLKKSSKDCLLAHIPNWVFSGCESGRAFDNKSFKYDVFFAGDDYNESDRKALLLNIKENTQNLRFGLFQALNNPRIHGRDYYHSLENSLMGLSLSRKLDVDWYSSDRLQQMTGNGLCTFSPRTKGLEKLYNEDEIVWFDNFEELHQKIQYFMQNQDEAKIIAKKGWEKVHATMNSKIIGQYIIDRTYQKNVQDVSWKNEIY